MKARSWRLNRARLWRPFAWEALLLRLLWSLLSFRVCGSCFRKVARAFHSRPLFLRTADICGHCIDFAILIERERHEVSTIAMIPPHNLESIVVPVLHVAGHLWRHVQHKMSILQPDGNTTI